MAGSVIHMCVAKEVNKKLGMAEDLFLLGAIVPDIVKLTSISELGEAFNGDLVVLKRKSHFIGELTKPNIPDLDSFIKKYGDRLSFSFVMGYFLHLYTDKLWFENFLPKFDDDKIDNSEKIRRIYNDYDYFNPLLIKKYGLDLKFLKGSYGNCDFVIDDISFDSMDLFLERIVALINSEVPDRNLYFTLEKLDEFIILVSDSFLEYLDCFMKK